MTWRALDIREITDVLSGCIHGEELNAIVKAFEKRIKEKFAEEDRMIWQDMQSYHGIGCGLCGQPFCKGNCFK